MSQYDDAALARALQEEYEREYRRRSMQQHLGSGNGSSIRVEPPVASHRATAPVEEDVFNEPFYSTRASSAREPEFIVTDDSFGSVEVSDEAYARRLEQQMLEEEAIERRARKQHLQQQRDAFRSTRAAPSVVRAVPSRPQMTASSRSNSRSNVNTSSQLQRSEAPIYNTSSRAMAPVVTGTRVYPDERSGAPIYNTSSRDMVPAVTGTRVYSDEELARRLEQEMRDEELARQAFVEEQIRQSSISARAMANSSANRSNSSGCCRRFVKCSITLLLVAAVVGVCVYFLSGNQSVKNFIPDPTKFGQADPYNNANISDANLWQTPGTGGLQLSVINALDSKWHPYFYKAVSQWDGGSPDALTLSTETASPDSVCNPVDGKLKVCNGNYGDTNWRGINKVLLENGWIYSSAARMNEYYNGNNDPSQMQYTMCHEIGHGFGLPHTDENFFNKDLGNCMDYTNNPQVNMQPAYANFKFLARLYGTVDGSPIPTDDAVQSSNLTVPETAVQQQSGGGSGRGRNVGALETVEDEPFSPAVVAALEDIDRLVDNGLIGSEQDGWRMLHESPHGHSHEIDVGNGFTIQIHVLI